MVFKKPKNLTFQQIADQSGVSIRTVKRYASGENITTRNVNAINLAVADLKSVPKRSTDKCLIPPSQKEFFFPKAIFRQNLFWSSPVDKTRNIDGVIETYVKTPNLYDIYTLVRLFGEKRVVGIAREIYTDILKEYGISLHKLSSLPEYQSVLRMVQYSLSVRT